MNVKGNMMQGIVLFIQLLSRQPERLLQTVGRSVVEFVKFAYIRDTNCDIFHISTSFLLP